MHFSAVELAKLQFCKFLICKEFGCKAKMFTRKNGNLGCLIGKPDLILLFTNPVFPFSAIIY
jgi:hypothetical protein